MAEIRLAISETLDKIIENLSSSLGVTKTEYIRTLVINDIRSKGMEIKGEK
jgi:hypothetical protein